MDVGGLDAGTGTWRFDGSGCVLAPGLTRAAFEAHAEAATWSSYAVEEPYDGYRRGLSLAGEPLTVVVWFAGEDLRRITIGTGRSEIVGSGWGEYDLRAGISFHEGFVERLAGPRRAWAWGRIGVGVDPVDGTSEIVVDIGPSPTGPKDWGRMVGSVASRA